MQGTMATAEEIILALQLLNFCCQSTKKNHAGVFKYRLHFIFLPVLDVRRFTLQSALGLVSCYAQCSWIRVPLTTQSRRRFEVKACLFTVWLCR